MIIHWLTLSLLKLMDETAGNNFGPSNFHLDKNFACIAALTSNTNDAEIETRCSSTTKLNTRARMVGQETSHKVMEMGQHRK